MRISVALCTYNGSRHLRAQLDSLAAQHRLPDEVIVSDDCSDDDTKQIINAFARRAPFPVLFRVNEKNLGSTVNFGRAVALCEGDIIAFCDQDDVWREDKLACVERIFSAYPQIGAVISNAELVDDNLTPLNRSLWQVINFTRADQRRLVGDHAVEALLKCLPPAHGMAMAFRSAFKTAIMPIPSHYSHDTWTALIIALLSELKFIDECLVKYRQHQVQQVGLATRRTWMERLRRARISDSHLHLAEADLLVAVRRRVEELRATESCQEKLALLQSKAEHLHVRANTRRGGWRRLSIISKEIIRLRYHRYSNGVSSAVKDLICGGGTETRQSNFVDDRGKGKCRSA